MSSKRPAAKATATTDEWGIYDPAKAGMPALFARLGRPILRAAPTNARKERRRAQRPERPSEGVGLAIAEARRRAGIEADCEPVAEYPLVGGNPARAMRLALRAQAALHAMSVVAAQPVVAPAPLEPVVARSTATEAATPARKRASRGAGRTAAEALEVAIAIASDGATDQSGAVRRPRVKRAVTKARGRQATPAVEAAPAPPPAETAAASCVAAVANDPAPVPPAPSPRRPRGPVPLAAWAHAAVQPAVEPRRHHTLGFWRGIFRIPTEVALVEYAHGAKIHRLLIETADEPLPDFI